RLAALFRLAALAENARIGDCDLQLLLTLHRQVEPVVSEITEIHFNFTSGRHVEVTEIISMFQVDRICRSVMSVVESLRQTVGWLVCPFHFDDHSEELPEHLWPSKFLRQYFADVRMLARSGGTEVYTPEMVDEVSSAWASSEQELSALVLRLEHWSHESRRNGGRMKAETFSSVEVLIQRFMAMAVDFVRSLAEDMNAMFRAPNYVSREMTPGGAADTMESRDQESPVTVQSEGLLENDLYLLTGQAEAQEKGRRRRGREPRVPAQLALPPAPAPEAPEAPEAAGEREERLLQERAGEPQLALPAPGDEAANGEHPEAPEARERCALSFLRRCVGGVP
ncbi:unnamed protein product, partial [Effrenium voratum]